MKQDLYPENLQVALDTFLAKMHLLNRADNARLVLKIVTNWTKEQPLLTKKLLQYVLESESRIEEGEESVAVEKIIRNRLLKEFKQDELTLNIRKSLYKKDFENLLEINNNQLGTQDRLYLAKIQRSLGLSTPKCRAIESQISLERYLSVERGGQILNHEDNFSQLSNIIIAENLESEISSTRLDKETNKLDLVKRKLISRQSQNQKNKFQVNKLWWILLFIPLLLASVPGINWLRQNRVTAENNDNLEQQKLCVDLTSRNSPRMSLGEKILTEKYSQANPQSSLAAYQGMAAFARCEFSLARQKYQQSLAINKNNPEALIYYNNAKAIAGKHFKIAVSIPLGSKPDIAWEILRGVAQAQTEINRQGGINGKNLLIQIANDDNDPYIVTQVAQQLSSDRNILAVVGHNDSNSSIAGAKIYQQEKLVMISPTSTSTKLSGMGDRIMRTIPSVSALAEKLANYAAEKSLTKIAICQDAEDSASRSFAREFSNRTLANGGTIQEINCNLEREDLQSESIVAKAREENVDALLLAPSVNNLEQAIDIARANQQKVPLLGNHSLYTYKTISMGQEAISGMVIPSPWLSDLNLDNNFPAAAMQFWGGKVNWRTAMAYDAVTAISQGLKQAETREELQSVLTSSDFVVNGATGRFQFVEGDRFGQVQLARVKAMGNGEQYQFSPLKL